MREKLFKHSSKCFPRAAKPMRMLLPRQVREMLTLLSVAVRVALQESPVIIIPYFRCHHHAGDNPQMRKLSLLPHSILTGAP